MVLGFQVIYIYTLPTTKIDPEHGPFDYDIIRSPKIYGAWRCAPNDNLSFGSHGATRDELSLLILLRGKGFEGNSLGPQSQVFLSLFFLTILLVTLFG